MSHQIWGGLKTMPQAQDLGFRVEGVKIQGLGFMVLRLRLLRFGVQGYITPRSLSTSQHLPTLDPKASALRPRFFIRCLPKPLSLF